MSLNTQKQLKIAFNSNWKKLAGAKSVNLSEKNHVNTQNYLVYLKLMFWKNTKNGFIILRGHAVYREELKDDVNSLHQKYFLMYQCILQLSITAKLDKSISLAVFYNIVNKGKGKIFDMDLDPVPPISAFGSRKRYELLKI